MDVLNRFWRAFFNLPVLIGAGGIACLFLALLLVGLGMWVPAEAAGPLPTAELLVIPGSTSTPYVLTPTPTRIPVVTSNMPPPPLPGMIGIGSSVQITGTDGSGLNIREEAGLGTNVNFVALDSEVFVVRDGPVIKDDITWWLLVTPLDETRSGWAASNYLSLVSKP